MTLGLKVLNPNQENHSWPIWFCLSKTPVAGRIESKIIHGIKQVVVSRCFRCFFEYKYWTRICKGMTGFCYVIVKIATRPASQPAKSCTGGLRFPFAVYFGHVSVSGTCDWESQKKNNRWEGKTIFKKSESRRVWRLVTPAHIDASMVSEFGETVSYTLLSRSTLCLDLLISIKILKKIFGTAFFEKIFLLNSRSQG